MAFPLIAAGIGAAGSLLGGIFQNNAAKSAASRQMRFQEKTLRHSYQWGMEDMRKAGLNPILAYKQGGAGSASGSSYTPQNVGSAAVQGGSTAAASALAQQRMEAELKNIKADTKLKGNQSDTQTALALQSRMAAAQSAASTGLTNQQNALLSFQTNAAKAAAAQAATDYQINKSAVGKIIRYIERGKSAINPFSGKGSSHFKQ